MINGAVTNPHGHGYAIVAGDRILVGRGMSAAEVIAEFTQRRERYPGGPALFHSRYATKGVSDTGNCHPFPLGLDQRTVLAHNGTLPKRVHPRAYDPRSDTRIAAEEYLPLHPFGSIDTHRGRRGLESWLGSNKLVILTVDSTYRQQAYLFGEQAGTWDGGVWYSNRSYLPPSRRWPARPYVCPWCGHFDTRRPGRYCGRCGWCFDCASSFPVCVCFDTTATDNEPTRRSSATKPVRRLDSAR
ncbi:class II glutamine amidotransferase [Nocardia cyriacigeorgica]|uniref:class II glutamine amidotransferase n=1 Tax=Nocardia cyriacigeorgica TaxID=135487 RepID=UPI002458833F|nr:class II glutamine amidotransferase [Nocardia cyriacigeorgica]